MLVLMPMPMPMPMRVRMPMPMHGTGTQQVLQTYCTAGSTPPLKVLCCAVRLQEAAREDDPVKAAGMRRVGFRQHDARLV